MYSNREDFTGWDEDYASIKLEKDKEAHFVEVAEDYQLVRIKKEEIEGGSIASIKESDLDHCLSRKRKKRKEKRQMQQVLEY